MMRRPLFERTLIAIVALVLPAAVLAQNAQPAPMPQRLIEPPPRDSAITPSPKETIPGIADPEKGVVRPAGAVDPSTLDLSKGK
jgi:hypothetical protein